MTINLDPPKDSESAQAAHGEVDRARSLHLIESLEPGSWIAVVSGHYGDYRPDAPWLDLRERPIEAAAGLVLDSLSLARAGVPIIYFDQDGTASAGLLPDVLYAVTGLAADAEGRRIPVATWRAADFRELGQHVSLMVWADGDGEPHAFLLRKGLPALT